MPVISTLDMMLAKRKKTLSQLSEMTGFSLTNLSLIKTSKARAVRFSTLEIICRALDCEIGDLYKVISEEEYYQLFGREWYDVDEDD